MLKAITKDGHRIQVERIVQINQQEEEKVILTQYLPPQQTLVQLQVQLPTHQPLTRVQQVVAQDIHIQCQQLVHHQIFHLIFLFIFGNAQPK